MIGLGQARLDEIELRLVGADHRPWRLDRSLYDENGRALICKGSKKAAKKAEWGSLAWSDDDNKPARMEGNPAGNLTSRGVPPDTIDQRSYVKFLALFKLCDEATEDMAEFVAHAPEDVSALIDEVKSLRKRYRSCEKERDEVKKEMLSLRVEVNGYRERLTAIRRTWREFNKEMGRER